ncbi:MAG: translation-associated GTPase, partial [Pseudomonadota bacterium]
MQLSVIVTLSAILWWALLSAVSRVLMVNYALDPWLFGFLQLCIGGFALLLVSGRGGFDPTSFKRPSTWAISGFRVLSAAIYTVVLSYISVLEAGTLG